MKLVMDIPCSLSGVSRATTWWYLPILPRGNIRRLNCPGADFIFRITVQTVRYWYRIRDLSRCCGEIRLHSVKSGKSVLVVSRKKIQTGLPVLAASKPPRLVGLETLLSFKILLRGLSSPDVMTVGVLSEACEQTFGVAAPRLKSLVLCLFRAAIVRALLVIPRPGC